MSEGHEAIVISNGGRMVESIEASGARHIAMPVHRKNLISLLQVLPLKRLLEKERPDILHIRSRAPGWIAYFAWRGINPKKRPRLVSTVHGFYSVNFYSAVMTKGESVIAVSKSVRDYILKNYPHTDAARVRVIHRGVDETVYPPGFIPSAEWLSVWKSTLPSLEGRIPLLMPGRLTRWKGQEDFIRIIAALIGSGHPVHGLIVGEPHPKKLAFLDELKQFAASLGVSKHMTFLGHRNDLREIMAISAVVFSLSRDPEAFGRVSLEAMALGKPVVGYNHGGVAEQLQVAFPEGLVEPSDFNCAIDLTAAILKDSSSPSSVELFSLKRMLNSTLEVYQSLLASSHH